MPSNSQTGFFTGSQGAARRARVDWLLAHRHLWIDIKLGTKPSIHEHFMQSGFEVAKAMKDAGLFSATTYVNDIRWARYVRAAQVELRKLTESAQ